MNNIGLSQKGFTFIELIIVIAVIGIMSALAISSLSNGANDAREIVYRQQQATLQTAVSAWVSSQLMGNSTVSQVRGTYNAETTSVDRLELVKEYLDDVSYEHFKDSSSGSKEVLSAAAVKLGWEFRFTTWADGSYPKVEKHP